MINRITELDGLRAYAVLAVVILHAWPTAFPGGFIGVDLFFVISGAIITRLLLSEHDRTGHLRIGAFYGRRIRRLWPALFVLLAAVLAENVLRTLVRGSAEPDTFELAAVAAASLMNWWRAFEVSGGGILGHTWSLAIEEQFYLVWPLTLAILMAAGGRRLALRTVLAGVGVVVLWRLILVADGATIHRTYNALDTRADALLIGCALVLIDPRTLTTLARPAIAGPAALALGAAVLTVSHKSAVLNTVGFTLVATLSAVVVAASFRPGPLALVLLGARPVVWIGVRSYSLYLWHYPIQHWVRVWWGAESPYAMPLAIVLSVIAADLSYRLIERRFIARGTPRTAEWHPSRESALSGAQVG